MKIYYNLESCPQIKAEQVTVIIGNFDGVHLGHQVLLKKLSSQPGKRIVITFSNHPQAILYPTRNIILLTTTEQKLNLISEYDIDILICLKFDSQLANLKYEEFLLKVRENIPFSDLILGHDAHIGKARQGNHNSLKELSEEWDFNIDQVKTVFKDGITVSSSNIRKLIYDGKLETARKLLQRSYSIRSPIIKISENDSIDKSALILDLHGLAAPENGIYIISLSMEDSVIYGLGEIEVSEDFKNLPHPIMKIYLNGKLDHRKYNIDQTVEVTLHKLLRRKKALSLAEKALQLKIDLMNLNNILRISDSYFSSCQSRS